MASSILGKRQSSYSTHCSRGDPPEYCEREPQYDVRQTQYNECRSHYGQHSRRSRSPAYSPRSPQHSPPIRGGAGGGAEAAPPPLFDKMPSYFTELSFRSRLDCPARKATSAELALSGTRRCGFRDPSPEYEPHYDKVPSYLTCFTNSTKYDGFSCYRDCKSLSAIQKLDDDMLRNRESEVFAIPKNPPKVISDEDYNRSERCQIYVGNCDKTLTESELYKMFNRFGHIKTLKIHRRNHGDNYAFIDFEEHTSADTAVEVGHNNPGCNNYDISFSGRRQYLNELYSDFDGDLQQNEEQSINEGILIDEKYCFDDMLKMATKRIAK